MTSTITTILVCFLIILSLQLANEGFSISPATSRVFILDEIESGNQNTGNIDLYSKDRSNVFANIPIDIKSISYASDGNFLNGTIWLKNVLNDTQKHSDYLDYQLSYRMNIYLDRLDSRLLTYSVVVIPELDGTWSEYIFEIEPSINPNKSSGYRLIEKIGNYTPLIDGKNFIQLYLDLKLIGYPTSYWVEFKTNGKDFRNGFVYDDYVLLESIPKKANVYDPSIPETINLLRGEPTNVQINVTSIDLYDPTRLYFEETNKEDGVIIQFEPAYMDLPLNGNVSTIMKVSTKKNFVDTTDDNIQHIRITSANLNNPAANYSSDHIFKINFEDKVLEEGIGQFLNRNPLLIYLIPILITLVFSIWLYFRVNVDEKVIGNLKKIKFEGLLATNSGVIAGVLVFLTVGSSDTFFKVEGFQRIAILTSTIVIPFSLSAIAIMLRHSLQSGIKLMTIGFVYLMVSVLIIAFSKF